MNSVARYTGVTEDTLVCWEAMRFFVKLNFMSEEAMLQRRIQENYNKS